MAHRFHIGGEGHVASLDGATNAAEVMRRCLENDDDTTLALSEV